jgi:hypothetical protein
MLPSDCVTDPDAAQKIDAILCQRYWHFCPYCTCTGLWSKTVREAAADREERRCRNEEPPIRRRRAA